jgi:hypothetical protein
MSTSIKTVSAGPETVRSLPLTADLNISEQKVRGEAYGRVSDMSDNGERLIREAVARALGQDPPKTEGPDVLVGMNVRKEQSGKNLSVTVTGYPGWYHNFRTVESGDSAWLILTNTGGVRRGGPEGLPIIAPGQITVGGLPKPKGTSGKRYYLGANMMLAGSRSMTGEWLCLEGGLRGMHDMSYGFELGGGFFGEPNSNRGKSESMGGGFNASRTYDLPSDIGQLVYGVSAGFWYGYYNKYQRDNSVSYNRDESQDDYLFGGPFVKLRWKLVELSYRGLIGKEERVSRLRRPSGSIYRLENEDGFAWVSQLKLGVHLKL